MTNIEQITLKYFSSENIESVKEFNGRIIVTLKGLPEQPEKAQALKTELQTLEGVTKTSVIFTQSAAPSVTPALEKWQPRGVKKIIAVASGKGGVGKSTTAVNLALALADLGQKIAIFDADIYGPSLPTMLGFENTPPVSYDGKTFLPFQNYGIKAMSIGSMISRDTPLIWRGAKACGAIEQLLTQTDWGETDIMVIDMPPGTGDIQITLSQRIDFSGAVIVSTPQDIALIDAVKGVNMFKKTDVPILGIIENMSYYLCEKCGHRADIFGHEGARQTAAQLGETFLGEIPLHMEIRQNADNGTPIVAAAPDSPHTEAYRQIAARILEKLK